MKVGGEAYIHQNSLKAKKNIVMVISNVAKNVGAQNIDQVWRSSCPPFVLTVKRFKVGVSLHILNEEGCYVYVNRQDGNTFSYHPCF